MTKLIVGENDLLSKNPELAEEWDYEKNSFGPTDVTYGSKKKAWWICRDCGYSWPAQIYARNNGNGCPQCGYKKSARNSHRKRLNNGDNTLLKKYPELLVEWNYEKNTDINPDDVTPHCATEVWWKCGRCGHSYLQKICAKTNDGKGCPVCAGVSVQRGINDLASVNPSLAEEWDYGKNGSLLPTQVTANSNRKVYWKCRVCNHSWPAMISDRNKGTGCPICKKIFHSSFPEFAIFYYLKKYFPDAINGFRSEWLEGNEIDIFVPSLNFGIEYDGKRWHQNHLRDETKTKIILGNGVRLFRIREPGLKDTKDGSIVLQIESIDKQGIFINGIVTQLANLINAYYGTNWVPLPDIAADELSIRVSYSTYSKDSSFGALYPELIDEWDFLKNDGLSPFGVTAHSETKVYWRCKKCDYSWKTSVATRVNGHGCPACAGVRLYPSHNDLATLRPDLLEEWNYTLNSPLQPNKVTASANKKVFWHCNKCNGDYLQLISSKTRGCGCPICSGKIVVAGINDMATVIPALAKEWHFERNGELTPEMVTAASNKTVWWKCSMCGAEWPARIDSRKVNKCRCPQCHHNLQL